MRGAGLGEGGWGLFWVIFSEEKEHRCGMKWDESLGKYAVLLSICMCILLLPVRETGNGEDTLTKAAGDQEEAILQAA